MEKTHRKAVNLRQLAKIANVSYDRAAKAFSCEFPELLKTDEKIALIKALESAHKDFVNFLTS